jgi:23S rRNA C2498 (ribose-2'-O)-methylase RlmM
VIFEGYQQDDGEKLVRDLPFSSLIFARQMFVARHHPADSLQKSHSQSLL